MNHPCLLQENVLQVHSRALILFFIFFILLFFCRLHFRLENILSTWNCSNSDLKTRPSPLLIRSELVHKLLINLWECQWTITEMQEKNKSSLNYLFGKEIVDGGQCFKIEVQKKVSKLSHCPISIEYLMFSQNPRNCEI